MKKLMVILIGFLLAYLLAGCGGSDIAPTTMAAATPATTPLAAATSTPTPAATATTAPTSTFAVEPTSEPVSSPVEFVSQITGDPNPLSLPAGLAIDQQGHLYVVDGGNHRLQVFASTGQFLTAWGSQGSDDGEFNLGNEGHGGVAVDGQGHVYIADSYNFRIQKFTSDGQFLTQWGSYGFDDGQFSRPFDVAVDGQGNVYVIDDHRNDIQKFDSDGKFLTKWGGDGAGDGQLANTGRIAVDEQGNIYVSDYYNNRVQKFRQK